MTVQAAVALWWRFCPRNGLAFVALTAGAIAFDASLLVGRFSGGWALVHLLFGLIVLGIPVLALVLAVWGVLSRSWEKLLWAATAMFFLSFLGAFSIGVLILLPAPLIFSVSVALRFFREKRWAWTVFLPLAALLWTFALRAD